MIKLKGLLTEKYNFFESSRELVVKNLDGLASEVKKSTATEPEDRYAIKKMHAFYGKVVALRREWAKLSKDGF